MKCFKVKKLKMEGEEVIDLEYNKLKLATNEIFEQMNWFCLMYEKMGEAEAQGVKIIRDENTGKNWTRVELNLEKKKFAKNSKNIILNNYKLFAKTSKKKVRRQRKIILNEDGTKQDNINVPVVMSDHFYNFFKEVDLGTVEVEGKKVKFQDTLSCFKGKDKISNPTVMSNLFDVWILYTNLKDVQGNVVKRGLQDPIIKGKVYANEEFKKHFKADLDKIITEKKQTKIPLENTIVIVEGKNCKPTYELPYPTFFKVLVAKNKIPVPKEEREKYRQNILSDDKNVRAYKLTFKGEN